MEVLFFLFIFFAIVTLVGHAIWVTLAAAFRYLSEIDNREATLHGLRKRFHELLKKGVIDPSTFQKLNRALEKGPAPEASTEKMQDAGLLNQPAGASLEAPQPQDQMPVIAEPVLAEVVEPESGPAPKKDPQQRVAEYVRRRQHALSEKGSDAPSAPTVEKKPERSIADLLSSFLEVTHIRWGELVGGLLIVSSSTALVISFWAEISSKNVLKFGVFNSVIVLLFFVGIYAFRRWNLPTTSQGVLTIAMLLVPLNFLAIAAFTENSSLTTATLAGEFTSIVVLSVFGFLAARILTPQWPIETTACAVGLPVWQLLVRRFVEPGASNQITMAMISGISATYFFSQLPVVFKLRRLLPASRQLEEQETSAGPKVDPRITSSAETPQASTDQNLPMIANGTWLLLGIASFAVVLCLGFLVVRKESASETLQNLSCFTGILAAPAIAFSAIFWNQTRAHQRSTIAITSSAIGLCAVLVLAAGVWFSWPNPTLLIFTCSITFAIATSLAFINNLKETHYFAAPFLLLAVVLLCKIAVGELSSIDFDSRQTLNALVSYSTGWQICVGFGFSALFGILLGRFQLIEHRNTQFMVAAFFAGASILVACALGFGRVDDPALVVGILSSYGVLAVAGTVWKSNKYGMWIGNGLVLLACVQAIVFAFAFPFQAPLLVRLCAALLGFCSLSTLGLLLLTKFSASQDVLAPTKLFSICGAVAIAFLLAISLATSFDQVAPWQLLWLAAVWLVLSIANRSSPQFTAFQWTTYLAAVLAVYRWQADLTWHFAGVRGWLHPISIEAQTILCASFNLGWNLVRVVVRRTHLQSSKLNEYLNPSWPSADRIILAMGLVGLVFLSAACVIPGVGQELALVERNSIVPPVTQFWFDGLERATPDRLVWIALALTFAAYLFTLYDHLKLERNLSLLLIGLLLTIYLGFVLPCWFWESQIAVASALRWSLSIFFVVASLSIWTTAKWLPHVRRIGLSIPDELPPPSGSFTAITVLSVSPLIAMVAYVCGSAFVVAPPAPPLYGSAVATFGLTGLGIVIICFANVNEQSERFRFGLLVSTAICGLLCVALIMLVVVQALLQFPIVGPTAESMFRRIGFNVSYVVPLLLYTIGLIGFAHFFVSARLAFTSGIMVCVCGTAAYLFLNGGGGFSTVLILNLFELNSILASIGVIVWILWKRYLISDAFDQNQEGLLQALWGIATGFFSIPIAVSIVSLFVYPVGAFPIESVARFWGWGSLVLLALSTWIGRQDGARFWSIALPFLLAIALLGTFETHRADTGDWLTYHIMLANLIVMTPVAIVLDAIIQKRHQRASVSATLFHQITILATALVAFRCLFGDPRMLWWSTGGMLAASISCGILTYFAFGKAHFRLTTILFNVTVSIWWWQTGTAVASLEAFCGWSIDFLRLNAAALVIPTIVGSLILRSRQTADEVRQDLENQFSRHKTIAIFGLAFTALFATGFGLGMGPLATNLVVGWSTVLLCICGTLVGLLWVNPRRMGLGLYVTGLCLVSVFLESLRTTPMRMTWSSCLVLSAFGLVAAYVSSRRPEFQKFANRFSLSLGETSLYSVQGIGVALAIYIASLGVWVQFSSPIGAIRLACSHAILAQGLALAFLARGKRESEIRIGALLIGVVGAMAFSWSWFEHDAVRLLDRIVSAATAIGVMLAVYSVGFVKLLKRENDWTRSALQLVPYLAVCMGAAILFVLSLEGFTFATTGTSVEISKVSIGLVLAVLLLISVACLMFAIWPGRDPLRLPTERRGLYIYAAEIALGLLFLHIRTSMPWLFRGWWQPLWPLIVVGIGFLGVGLAEFLQRMKRTELSKPFEQTGAFLPLLPAIAYWMIPSKVNYSLLMLSVGILYAVLSTLRKSLAFGLLATLAVNAGLWNFLQGQSIAIYEHPQIWLIPPAFCVLVAASINRHRLTESQFVSIRYFSAIVIYVSSTADIIINGVAAAPWLPIVLAAISITGVFAGILLRVRAFLFLGIAFLFVSMFSVVWHAAVDLQNTWLWWVCLFATGCAILFIFALFEKKRQAVLDTLARLKEWEA